MTTIDIVGGIYREKCAFPYWDQLLGSAGRAAMGLVGLVTKIRLHSALSKGEDLAAEASFGAAGIELNITRRSAPVEFDYLHCLAVPRISPERVLEKLVFPEMTGEVVIKFGMMECDPRITAHYGIYDPQSAFDPLSFSKSGSKAEHLAIVANRGEILSMAKKNSVDDAVRFIISSENAEVVVVKEGIDGATVYSGGESKHVPAFKTRNVFSIGSGDVFVTAFSYAWAIGGLSAFDAATFASRSTADYVETRNLAITAPGAGDTHTRETVTRAGGKVYLAGPFRETGQRMLIDDARSQLRALGMRVFSPIHEIGPGVAELVVRQDLAAIRECDAVFAILNGSSPGTVFEVGYARALDKPVYCVAQNMRDVDLKLPKGAGAHLHEDYVSALFQIAWRS
ncbi:PfkB family carbohydrate kinase [Mesorhizobium sp. M0011]|uniref:PfkB family carbohydrate kinase n=1 Tax=Mesorhizobium sp. M0011 TaxID=2956839 RepID=UPI00333E08DB